MLRGATAEEHFLRFGQLVPSDQVVVTLPVDALVRDALVIMEREGFDQIPVTRDASVVGVFSYRSFAQGIDVVRRQDDPSSYPVSEFLEDLRFVGRASEVGEALAALRDKGAVLLGDEDNLLAVVTSIDLNDFLWQLSEQFIILRDIELAVRYLVRAACSDDDELQACITDAVPAMSEGQPAPRLEDVTFGDLLTVVNNRQRFARIFCRTFGRSRELVHSTLDPVREVRNKVFHFRGDLSADEQEALAAARVWLRRKVRMVH